MKCENCNVKQLEYVVQVEGDLNKRLMQAISRVLNSEIVELKNNMSSFTIQENKVQEFKDFCKDHMNTDQVKFCVGNQPWQSIEKLELIFEKQWVDEIIKKHLIQCYYQPIVNQNQEIIAYELLARFMDQNGQLIFPGDIFDAAKLRGRLYALDRVCRMAAVKHSRQIKGKKAFINFIPTSIYSPEHCLRTTTQLAKQLDLNPSDLVFEVVETEQVKDHEHLKKILDYYKEKGFHYALDDVGEGFNTIEMLGDIKPSYMKLDIKYVQGVSTDVEKQAVAKRFLAKAKEINAVPLAEGVEEFSDFEWLKGQGYELFQGYLFGKPTPRP